MKINKKLLALMLTFVIGGAALTGCGQKVETPNAPVETPTTNPEEENTEAPEGENTEAPEENEENNTEEVTGEQDPTPAQETYFVAVDGIELPANMPMDDTMIKDLYGMDASLLESYYVAMPMMNVSATEVAVFELKDEKDADTVMAGIETRQKGLVEQWKSYLPAQLELVENYKTAVKGNMVLFVISEHADKIVEQFNAAN